MDLRECFRVTSRETKLGEKATQKLRVPCGSINDEKSIDNEVDGTGRHSCCRCRAISSMVS